MINRFKSALLNAVSSSAVEDKHVNGNQNGISSKTNPGDSHNGVTSRPVKYDYSRPHFLNLTTPDEIQVSADHAVRPIIVNSNSLIWNVGYAETINSGKSKRNEDQARIHEGILEFQVSYNSSESSNEVLSIQSYKVPYKYFALFDGHAGSGAAVAAASVLHTIVHEKLLSVAHHFTQSGPFCEVSKSATTKKQGVLWFPNTNVTTDSLIIGALESAFHEMDKTIEYENKHYEGVNGGCTVVVCLFILGKVYIANAGDSRAILCRRNKETIALSNDFTPETERTRVRQLAATNPELLGGEFTSNEYLRRPVKRDLGSKILYRGAHMTGWAYKVAEVDDLKFPVVFGQGKRSRVLATIGVTRGFGDHELSAHSTSARIKPFLSSQPEVKVLTLEEMDLGEDDAIVMGTDGLWDVVQNDVVSSIVFSTVDQFPTTNPIESNPSQPSIPRFSAAAQDLVMHARGKFSEKRNWRMSSGSAATIDDISVFVIPLWPYKLEILDSNNIIRKIESDDSTSSTTTSVDTHPMTREFSSEITENFNVHVQQNGDANGDVPKIDSTGTSDKTNNNRQQNGYNMNGEVNSHEQTVVNETTTTTSASTAIATTPTTVQSSTSSSSSASSILPKDKPVN